MKTKIRPIIIGALSTFAVVACLALLVPTQSADANNTTAIATGIELTTEETTTVTSTTETETTTVTEASTEETTVAAPQTEATVEQTQASYSAPQTEAYVAPAPQARYNQVEFLGYYFNVGPVLASNIYDSAGVKALANYIDSGGIGAMGSPLNVYCRTQPWRYGLIRKQPKLRFDCNCTRRQWKCASIPSNNIGNNTNQ